jgi:hypothetical protein
MQRHRVLEIAISLNRALFNPGPEVENSTANKYTWQSS